jgi:hypothetical protein
MHPQSCRAQCENEQLEGKLKDSEAANQALNDNANHVNRKIQIDTSL